MQPQLIERQAATDRHATFFLSCGPADGPLIVFLHGWPELSLSWRHQLRCFGALGFHAVAPDMRGYGRSTVHAGLGDYALEHSVQDMLELLDALGRKHAVWVGHDWGAPVAWAIASHHPEASTAVAGLCAPYLPGGFTRAQREPLIDRATYPQAQYPAGQWDYMLHYEERFDDARACFEADPEATVRAMFRKGSPKGVGRPSPLASIRREGGWFGGAKRPPVVPLDTDVLTDDELRQYAQALKRNGFFGPNAWYMNDAANAAYAQRARNVRLAMPALFFHAAYDTVCETLRSSLAQPMREHCDRLTEITVESGHWMAQEKPAQVNAGLARWLATQVGEAWPGS
jgi:pimeloyl-ACP methyl ester carboxylesterase